MSGKLELNPVGTGWRAHGGFLSNGRRVFWDLGYLGKVTVGQDWEENMETSE